MLGKDCDKRNVSKRCRKTCTDRDDGSELLRIDAAPGNVRQPTDRCETGMMKQAIDTMKLATTGAEA